MTEQNQDEAIIELKDVLKRSERKRIDALVDAVLNGNTDGLRAIQADVLLLRQHLTDW
jgi:hypothetical protein